MSTESVSVRQTLLFVPGNRPERFAKALGAGADMVCIDLEDAVPPRDKALARNVIVDFLNKGLNSVGGKHFPEIGVRCNSLSQIEGLADVLALSEQQVTSIFVMLPKVESPEAIRQLVQLLPRASHILPILETPLGLSRALEICSEPGVQCALFGGVDYVAETGVLMNWQGLYWARATLVNAAAATDTLLFDLPYVDVKDNEGLRRAVIESRGIGIQARAAIHPQQVPIIQQALAPSDEEVAQAHRVIEAFELAEGAAAQLDGKLIELPVVKAANRILALAENR